MSNLSGDSAVQELIGLELISVSVSTGLMRLLFERGWELVVYNPVTMEVSGEDSPLGDGNMLVGKTVVRCVTMRDEFLLQLSADVALQVDLRDEAFVGPEAMQFIGPQDKFIIWN